MTDHLATAIQSERYGELRVTEEQIYRFEKGIVGWQNIHQYAMIPLEDSPFYILHALQDQVSFFLIPAELAVQDYGFNIDQDTVELLGVSRPEDVSTLLIVNILDNKLYVNLRAPVLLSPLRRSGVQFIIHDRDYPLRYPLKREEDGGTA